MAKKAVMVEGPNLEMMENYGATYLLEKSIRPWTFGHPLIQQVELDVLNKYASEYQKVSLIKIEVEGTKFEVLEGAQRLVQR